MTPTQIILAIYYLLADVVLLGQCFYYRGFTWHDDPTPLPKKSSNIGEASETTGLLQPPESLERRTSAISADHLSPAVPLLDDSNPAPRNQKPTTALQATLFNLVAVLMVCIAGVFGWWLSERAASRASRDRDSDSGNETLEFSLWGQVFGYICAVLYLGSRVPQLLLVFRRKHTEGMSLLFVLFSCLGNLTYVLSIFAYEAHCQGKHGECRKGEAASLYGRYIAVNASWLAGSLGTLLLDLVILTQFFVYMERDGTGGEERSVANGGSDSGHRERSLLNRDDSGHE